MPNKQKNARNKTNKNKKTSRKMRVNPSPQLGLSHCAAKYALAIADPWASDAEGACVPRHPSRPSQKVRGFARFKMTIGTGGVGFVYFCPTVANNSTAVLYSNVGYAGTNSNVAVTSVTAGVSSGQLTTLPYTAANFTPADIYTPPAMSGRIVSAGMSWQYTGSVSNMGGVSYALVEPSHANTNNIGTDQLGAYAETSTTRVDSRRHWVGVSAIDDTEINYPESTTGSGVSSQILNLYPYSNGEVFSSNAADTGTGGAPVALWIQSTPGNTFQIEIVVHLEYVGRAAQAAYTPTHSDARGFEMVANAAARLPALSVSKPDASRPSLMREALSTVAHELAPVGTVLGKTALRLGAEALVGAVTGGGLYGPAGLLPGAALGAARGALRIANS